MQAPCHAMPWATPIRSGVDGGVCTPDATFLGIHRRSLEILARFPGRLARLGALKRVGPTPAVPTPPAYLDLRFYSYLLRIVYLS
jgi:hypothetical protein